MLAIMMCDFRPLANVQSSYKKQILADDFPFEKRGWGICAPQETTQERVVVDWISLSPPLPEWGTLPGRLWCEVYDRI
jgi:hypothetical protein